MLGFPGIGPINVHDAELCTEGFAGFADSVKKLGVDLVGAKITFDHGFDSKAIKGLVKDGGATPVICPNRRNIKEPIAVARLYRWFDRTTYQTRIVIERVFAWEDVYRKIALSYDRLPEIRMGCRYVAASMINFRVTFHTREWKPDITSITYFVTYLFSCSIDSAII